MTLSEIIAHFEAAERGQAGERIASVLDRAYAEISHAQSLMDEIGEGAMADELQDLLGE